MNLCSAGHDEVCYDQRECPVCKMESEKNDEISTLESRVHELEVLDSQRLDEIKDLNHTVETMQDEINGLQSDLRDAI